MTDTLFPLILIFQKNDNERFLKAYKEVKEKYKLSRTDIGWFIDNLNFNLF